MPKLINQSSSIEKLFLDNLRSKRKTAETQVAQLDQSLKTCVMSAMEDTSLLRLEAILVKRDSAKRAAVIYANLAAELRALMDKESDFEPNFKPNKRSRRT